jgi:endonuclease G
MRQGKAFCAVAAALFLLSPLLAAGSAAPPLPGLADRSFLLQKTALSISYNVDHKQADWVFYPLGPDQLRSCAERGNSFRPDPTLPPGQSSQLSDYQDSGYDRGHLSPAADNKFSPAAMRESFYLSNISPQPAAFNQRIWARFENLVRGWAMQMNGIWVTTGPLLEGGLPTIGGSRVSVPDYYYKVVVTQNSKEQKALAFLLPTSTESRAEIASYAISIDDLEERTRLDFNQGLPREDALERGVNLRGWDFRATYQPLPCRDDLSAPQNLSSLFTQWAQ